MRNYVVLELDTTGPEVEVGVPSYTNQSAKTPITIEANEKLSNIQEIYIIDAEGVRHDLTFLYNEDNFYGEMYFSDYPLGVTTIYAQLMDAVHNPAPLISASFNLVDSEIMVMDMDMKAMDNKLGMGIMVNEITIKQMKNKLGMGIMVNDMDMSTMDNTMTVVVKK